MPLDGVAGKRAKPGSYIRHIERRELMVERPQSGGQRDPTENLGHESCP